MRSTRNINGSWWRRSECDQHRVPRHVGPTGSRWGTGCSLSSPSSREWEGWGEIALGAAGPGGSLMNPPNPLIRFLAQEMGLFSPFRLRHGGRKLGGDPGACRGEGGACVGGGGSEMLRPRVWGHQQLVTALCDSQDGKRCPVCPAQGGESHIQVPLPRQVQAPQGTAVPGMEPGGAHREPSPAQLRQAPCSAGRGRGNQSPLLGWVFCSMKPVCKSVPLKKHPSTQTLAPSRRP